MSNPSWLPTWPSTWPDYDTIFASFTIPRQYPRGLYTDVTSDEYNDIQAAADVFSWTPQATEWIKRTLWPHLDSEALFLSLWESALGVAQYATTATRQAALTAYARILQRNATSDLVKAIFTQVFSTDDPANVSYDHPTLTEIEAATDCYWEEAIITNGPGTRNRRYAMAYDSKRHRAILFGGLGAALLDTTYEYDFGTTEWAAISSTSKPSARQYTSMAYDPDRDVMVLFGGYDGASDAETWEFDCDTDQWSQIVPVANPGARYGHAIAYDETRNEVILFGGYDGAPDAETWSYDPVTPTWTNEAPATTPPARYGHRLTWDPDNAVICMTGGRAAGATHYNDLYRWNGTDWSSVAVDPAYDEVFYHAAWYDSHRKRLVINFGLENASGKNCVRYHSWELPYGSTEFARHLNDICVPRYEIEGVYSTKYRCGMTTMGHLESYAQDTHDGFPEKTYHLTHNRDTYARCLNYLHVHHTGETQDEDSTLANSLIQRTRAAWQKWTCGRYNEAKYGNSSTGAEYGTWDACTYESD